MFAITRDDADADALLAEVLEGLRGIAAPLLTEREHRDGQQPRGELFRVGALVDQRVRAEPEHERAPSARRALDHGRAERVGLVAGGRAEDHLRRPEHPRARRVVERHRAPLARRRERDRQRRATRRLIPEGRGERAAPTAKAMDVMSTSPSGIIAVIEAIVAVTASTHTPDLQA